MKSNKNFEIVRISFSFFALQIYEKQTNKKRENRFIFLFPLFFHQITTYWHSSL